MKGIPVYRGASPWVMVPRLGDDGGSSPPEDTSLLCRFRVLMRAVGAWADRKVRGGGESAHRRRIGHVMAVRWEGDEVWK